MLKLLRKLLLLEMILRTPLLQLVLIELLWEFRMQIIILILVQLARLGIPQIVGIPVLLGILLPGIRIVQMVLMGILLVPLILQLLISMSLQLNWYSLS